MQSVVDRKCQVEDRTRGPDRRPQIVSKLNAGVGLDCEQVIEDEGCVEGIPICDTGQKQEDGRRQENSRTSPL